MARLGDSNIKMNCGGNSNNAAADHSVPTHIEIPHVTTKRSNAAHHELASQSSSVYLYGKTESSCPGSDATLQDLEDMKRMVRELRNKSMEEVYQTLGLDSEGDGSKKCVRQVSIDDVDK